MRKIYSFLKGMSAVKSLFLSLLCLWGTVSVSGQITVPTDYPTLQAAVTAAPDGATITVLPGAYTAIDIKIEKSLTILGPHANTSPNSPGGGLLPIPRGAEAVITTIPGVASVPGPGTDFHAAFIVKNLPGGNPTNVVIKGFTFKKGSPMQDGHSNPPFPTSNIVFENNIIDNGQLIYGGYYWGDIQINNNNFNNTVPIGDLGLTDAVYLLGGNNVTVSNNVIQTAFVGILVKGQLSPIPQITIKNNRVSTTTEEAIQIGEKIGNAIVSENVANGASSIGGIRVYLPTISGRADIRNNTVTGSFTGVNFTDGDANQPLYVNYNSFTGSTSNKEIINTGTGTLKAECNWYGSAEPAFVTSKIQGDVDYTPYLLSGDDVSDIMGFQSRPACGTVTPTDITCLALGSIKLSFDGTYSYSVTGPGLPAPATGGPLTGDATVTGLTAGVYNIVITGLGSSYTTSATINNSASVVMVSSTQQDIKCFGDKGSIDITVTGGTIPYTYAWTATNGGVIPPGQEDDEDLTSLVAGTYTVVVTDSKGCKATKIIVLTQPAAALTATETHTDVNCFGNATGAIDLSVSGGTSPYTYAWTASNGGVVPAGQSANQDLTGLVAGTYSVIVTDVNKCTTSKSVTIAQPTAALAASTTQVNSTCAGATGSIDLSVTGGTPSYTYLWTASGGGVIPSGQEDDQDLTGLVAGTYSVAVTDSKGCKTTQSATITSANSNITATETHTDVNCFGNATGAIDLSVSGGTSPYTYAWTASNGGVVPAGQSANQDLTGLVAGTYSVIVTDVNKCTTSKSVTIAQPTAALAASTTQVNSTCAGATGSIDLSVTGGTPSYTYLWTASGGGVIPSGQEDDQDLTGLVAGTYSVAVTDSKGCKTTQSATITSANSNITATETHTDVNCFGNATGAIDLSVSGGTSPYTYAWTASNGGVVPAGQSANQDLTGLVAGTYSVIVTDVNKCTTSKSVTIAQPTAALAASTTQVNSTCAGATGSIDLSVTGGTPSYTYLWTASGGGVIPSGQEDDQDLTGLVAGTYSVAVTDSKGCKTTQSATITSANSNITATETHTDVNCFGNATGAIDLSVSGGTSPYTYAWTASNGGVVPAGQSANQDLTGLVAGTYSVIVTDKNKCTTSKTITIAQPASALSATETHTNGTCNVAGSINLSVSGGTPAYTYSWTASNGGVILSGQADDQDLSGLVAGTYTVLIKDSKLCTKTLMVTVTSTPCPPVCTLKAEISNKKDVTCFGGNNGSVTITATGGTAPYTGTGTFTGLKAGNYSYKVKDCKGCEVYVSFYIDEPDELKTPYTQKNVTCKGASDGSVTFAITGGTSPYVIKNVTTGANNLSNPVTGLKAGTYSFLITDKNGCCKTVSVCITEPSTPCAPVCAVKATITDKDDVTCYGGNNGSITITATGGTAPYTGTGTFKNLKAGNYSYKVKDNKGCEVYVSFNIDEPDELKVHYTQKNVSCKDATDGSITFTISGGTSPYVIKNVTTGANNLSNPVTGLKDGTYSFLITDKNGCCKTVSVCITEPSTPCVVPCKVTVTTVPIPYCASNSTKGSATFTFTGKAPFKYIITPCNISGTSNDNTETVSLPEGTYTIKVTDATGCVKSLTFSVKETEPITGTIGVKLSTTFPGQKSKTIYIGYTTQYATLSADDIKGGTPPYTYKWYPSTGLATPNDDETKATPTCTTTYTLLVTDSKGCKFYKCVTIKVVDLRCGAYGNKVEICYKGKTLCVDKNLVSGYLATGATLGSCGCDDDDDDDKDNDGGDRDRDASGAEGAGNTEDDAPAITTSNAGGVYPNPTGGIFRVSLVPMNIPVQIVVGDANGKPITTVSRINSTTAGQTVDFNLSNQPVGMYLVRVVQGDIKKTYKVFIVR